MPDWLNFDDLSIDINTSILIKEPPCSRCACWKPHKEIAQYADGSVRVVGIACCTTSDHMVRDFSCYEEIETK